MILLALLLSGSDYASVHSDKALTSAEYAASPLTRLFTAPETKGFFRPLLERMESRRADDLPNECSGKGAIFIVYDVASKLTELAKEARDDKQLRVLAALGLGDAQLATLCVRPTGAGTEISGFMSLRRYSGMLATLGPNDVSPEQAFASHYWSGGLHVAANDAWTSLKQLDRAAAGTRGSRLDGIIQGAGTVLGANIEQAVIQPLTGRMSTGLIWDAKTKHAARVLDLQESDTAPAAALAALLAEAMPHADLGRKAKPNEWGFAGALSGVGTLGGSVFLKIFDQRLVLSEEPFGLDVAQAKVPSSKLPMGFAVITVDLARYRGLYERVGRPPDTKELFNDLRLASFVDLTHAPHPKHLFTGMDRATFVLVREDGGLRLRGFIR